MAHASNRNQLLDTSWNDAPQTRKAAGSIREFLVSVELWSPAKSTATVRKIVQSPLPRKPSERRDSLASSTPPEDRRIKEKASWFRGYGTPSTTAGHWRPATCKLSEEGDRYILNLYVDETILQHSIYIHLLRCTDIRPADRSLFFRNDCLGIYTKAGQRWLDNNTEEVIYIQFPTSDALNTWLALLRSYANPETYGRRLSRTDGGLYRMWRQIDLHVVQGRNMGVAKLIETTEPSPSNDAEASDPVDLDIFCEIYINNNLCGRTTVKKGSGALDWHEQLTFGDLPPFEELLVHVYWEKKVHKPVLLGSICITLATFRRGERVDGWFPVLNASPSEVGVRIGEIRLKVKVDEEIILPNSAYSAIIQTMSQRNTLDLLNELEQEMKLSNVSDHVIAIAVAKHVLGRDILQLANREVESPLSSQNTLFRGNTMLTRTMELAMTWYGKSFLEASVGPVIRRLCAEKVSIEVDPIRSGKSLKDHEKNVDLLVHWCTEFWKQIYTVRGECPNELRKLFQHIRQLVERRYEKPDDNKDLKWQSVSAFCFLRFIVPAILHPHLFGLCPGLPPLPVQRSLILVAKVMQSLANLNPTVQKEEFMRGIKDFMRQSLPAMIDYIVVVSTPLPERRGFPPATAEKHDRLQAINSLRERSPIMPTLHREAIPLLPHLLDVPKHLAILASIVVRNHHKPRAGAERAPDSLLPDFVRQCFEVEEQALQCVSRLARRPVSGRIAAHRGGLTSSIPGQTPESESGPSSTKKRRSARPSTAPSSSEPPDVAASRDAAARSFATAVHVSSSRKLAKNNADAVLPAQRSVEEPDSDLYQTLHPLTRVRTTPSLPTLDVTVETSEDTRKSKGFLRGFLARR